MSQDSMFALAPLRAALEPLELQLKALLAAESEEHRPHLAELLSEGWQVLAEQLTKAGTPALMDLIVLYAENLDLLLASREHGLSGPEQTLLKQWHEACRHYLQAPEDDRAITAWVSLLKAPMWQTPLDEADAAELIDGISRLAGIVTEDRCTLPESPAVPPVELETFIEPLSVRPVEPVDLVLVQLISREFDTVANDLTRTLARFNCASLAEYQQSLGANDFLLENINKACDTVGLFGLSYVFRRLWLNVVAKAADDHNYDAECNLFGIAL
ncbi:MAG: hypothetical protein ACU83V_12400, partial [Gammaproteobacteria bacterium]